MDLSITGNYLQPLGSRPLQSTSFNKGWEERINPSGKKGLLMPTPLGMDVGNVTRKQNFVNLSSQYLASGKFGQSIADQTHNPDTSKKLSPPR